MKRNIIFAIILPLIILMLFALPVLAQDENHVPSVSNIRIEQQSGTKLVDITYDISDPDGDLLKVVVAISSDGGKTFNANTKTFLGNNGKGIPPGKGKKITWNAGANLNYMVKITANDGKVSVSAIVGKDGAPMVLIPAGEFEMGNAIGEGYSDERPVHIVYLDAFYIDQYEVTNAQYKKFMDAKEYKAPAYWNDPNYNAPNSPVVGVTWHDAKAYADWARKRLPTEAEWEKSAKGGLVGNIYPWGNEITHDNANFGGTGKKDQWISASPVGSFAPNGYGLYDMAGNAWEWCADRYGSNYYANSSKSNPKGPNSGSYRVLRGGSWYCPDSYLRTAFRSPGYPSYSFSSFGFRCVQ